MKLLVTSWLASIFTFASVHHRQWTGTSKTMPVPKSLTARCPCTFSVTVPREPTSHVNVLVRGGSNFRQVLFHTILNVSKQTGMRLKEGASVHQVQVDQHTRVRVDVTGDASIQLQPSGRSTTCPVLLPEDSVTRKSLTRREDSKSPFLRVVGGDVASRTLAPYFALIVTPADSENWISCSGVSISPKHVLTAAHCRPSRASIVYLGLFDSTDIRTNTEQTVESVDIPPQFSSLEGDSRQFQYDMAVLTLTTDESGRGNGSDGSARQWMKVNVNESIPEIWSVARVAGYGHTEPDAPSSNRLQTLHQVDLPVVSASNCEGLYRISGQTVDYGFQFCAGYVGKGGCDSW